MFTWDKNSVTGAERRYTGEEFRHKKKELRPKGAERRRRNGGKFISSNGKSLFCAQGWLPVKDGYHDRNSKEKGREREGKPLCETLAQRPRELRSEFHGCPDGCRRSAAKAKRTAGSQDRQRRPRDPRGRQVGQIS